MESIHNGDIAVVDREGRLLYQAGDPFFLTYIRSAAKPFQLLPLLKRKVHEFFGFTQEELAVMTASHSGEVGHVKKVKSILKKSGLTENHLQCGIHPPIHRESYEKLLLERERSGVLHCNCSGKHSGMLALSKYMGWELDSYLDFSHPLQEEILLEISTLTHYPKDEIPRGIDGCGSPVYALPLASMARGYAQLTEDVKESPLHWVSTVMRQNPWYVGGTGRFETILMEKKGREILAKPGAEGIFCLGIIREGLGIALKIRDGSSRAIPVVLLDLLHKLHLITREELKEMRDSSIRNHRGEVVGEIESSFQLQDGAKRA